jgi:prephenate dehydratase
LSLFIHQDQPGALLGILTEFAVRGVNLTRIESRPTKKVLGDYYFSVDVEGHVADERISEAIKGLHRVCLDVRYLGSYPRHDGRAPVLRDGVTDHDFTEAREWFDRLKENG